MSTSSKQNAGRVSKRALLSPPFFRSQGWYTFVVIYDDFDCSVTTTPLLINTGMAAVAYNTLKLPNDTDPLPPVSAQKMEPHAREIYREWMDYLRANSADVKVFSNWSSYYLARNALQAARAKSEVPS